MSLTAAQARHLLALNGLGDRRPYWQFKCSKDAPCGHQGSNGMVYPRHHSVWTGMITPCALPRCACTVWALTVFEMVEAMPRNEGSRCRQCDRWRAAEGPDPERCTRRSPYFMVLEGCRQWERAAGVD